MPARHEAWVGIFLALAATVVWVLLVWLWHRARLWRDFHYLEGEYNVRRKGEDHIERQTASIKVRKNVLEVTHTFPDEPTSFGDVVMSEQFPRSGRGQYSRRDDRWGFWDVQVKDKHTLLVHETYAHPVTKAAVVSGYVWSQIEC